VVDKSQGLADRTQMIWTIFQVAIGGAIGSVLRHLSVAAFTAPLATFIVNVAGCFVMGILYVGLASRAQFSPLLMTGILGGFTTFSAYSLDALKLWQSGQTIAALAYTCGTVVLSLTAVALGAALAREAFA